MWASFEPLSSYRLGPITIDTLVVKGLMQKIVDEFLAFNETCADTKCTTGIEECLMHGSDQYVSIV